MLVESKNETYDFLFFGLKDLANRIFYDFSCFFKALVNRRFFVIFCSPAVTAARFCLIFGVRCFHVLTIFSPITLANRVF